MRKRLLAIIFILPFSVYSQENQLTGKSWLMTKYYRSTSGSGGLSVLDFIWEFSDNNTVIFHNSYFVNSDSADYRIIDDKIMLIGDSFRQEIVALSRDQLHLKQVRPHEATVYDLHRIFTNLDPYKSGISIQEALQQLLANEFTYERFGVEVTIRFNEEKVNPFKEHNLPDSLAFYACDNYFYGYLDRKFKGFWKINAFKDILFLELTLDEAFGTGLDWKYYKKHKRHHPMAEDFHGRLFMITSITSQGIEAVTWDQGQATLVVFKRKDK